MSEIDELRRVAYGRTSTPAEEAAAEEAREKLAAHERAARAPKPKRKAGVTLHVVDYEAPNYLHQLASTWRVWAVPAFAAFVLGIVLTGASVLALWALFRG